MKPYVQGAGPLPNDEYGDAHTQVNPAFSRQTNNNIASMEPTDSNMMGMEAMHGQGSLDPGGIDSAYRQLRQTFGDDAVYEIFSELNRIAASQDVNGPMAQPPQLPTPPNFGPKPTSMPRPSNALADPRMLRR